MHSVGSARRGFVMVIPFALMLMASRSFAQDVESLLRTGQYDQAAQVAAVEVQRGVWNEKWPRLLIEAHLARGRYPEALAIYEAAIDRYPTSLTLRLLGRDVLIASNDRERAEREANQIFEILQRSSSRFASADNLVAAGRYFALRGEDARQILTLFYDRVIQAEPKHLEAHLATAELALSKGDYQVAAQTLARIDAADTGDPRVAYLLARAWAPSDGSKAAEFLERALSRNPNHAPSLLLQVDQAVDRERFGEAESILSKVLQTNPHHPLAWAYLAAIAHLRGNFEGEALMRAAALSTSKDSPEVDHLIGTKLSQNYRFNEGAAYQRRALTFDSRHTAASFQLAQDLLRTGQDEVGWELAKAVSDRDPYNVIAHNLTTLQDRLNRFSTLRSDGVHVRMDPREAEIYGDAVLTLLTDAKRVLCEKYEVAADAPIVVEIFPQQKDFAIRTFGVPGGAGFLGVCFGRLITANSPASQGESPANWQAVLWHEFCHAVTLEKTKNRMPRWLSEGISVYEERQRDPTWGQTITPVYREMLLDDALTPVSRLSSAFLQPPSPVHLQFAYYQSALVVEFLIEQHGFDSLNRLLVDLGDGLSIHDALARNVGSLERLDQAFAEHARELAVSYASEGDWSREGMPDAKDVDGLRGWLSEHPNHVATLRLLADRAIASQQWEEAIEFLERLRSLGVVTGSAGDPLHGLAAAYRALGREPEERDRLDEIMALSSDSLAMLDRRIELARQDEDWRLVFDLAQRYLAIQPLLEKGHEALAAASERLDEHAAAVASLRSLWRLDPIDPASVHFRLAKASAKLGDPQQARRHVVMALEEAPRYREAHRLLLEIVEGADEKVSGASESDLPSIPTSTP